MAAIFDQQIPGPELKVLVKASVRVTLTVWVFDHSVLEAQ